MILIVKCWKSGVIFHIFLSLFIVLLTVTKDAISAKAKTFVLSALTSISSDPINNLKIQNTITPGNKVKQLSDHFLSCETSSAFEAISKIFVKNIFDLMTGDLKTDKDLEAMWLKMHQFTLAENTLLLFNNLSKS